MLLFQPSPGQISDRMTILQIKIEKSMAQVHGHLLALDSAKIEKTACEAALRTYLNTIPIYQVFDFEKLLCKLQAQNRKQWDSEDAVRVAIKECADPPTYDELMQVYVAEKPNAEGNQIRASLVRQIDELFSVAPEVKIYA